MPVTTLSDGLLSDVVMALVPLQPPLGQTAVRRKYGVTVVGIKRSGQDFTYTTVEAAVESGAVIIVTGKPAR